MIDPQKAAEVRRLLAEPGATHRKVSAATGVSRATVGTIAAGRWAPTKADEGDASPYRPLYGRDCHGTDCGDCVACQAAGPRSRQPEDFEEGDGPLPQDPSPEEIRQRCREVLRSGGGRLVLPEIADPADLLEPYAANVRIDRSEEDDDAGSTEYCVADLMSSLEG
jgi:hypothetical protein